MIVFSGFDGMSCGRVALEESGARIEKYYSSEIDKYAIQIAQKNFPDTIQLGDIEKWREWNIDWSAINIIIGGSPCQGFSFAGKQLNFSDPRSKLFFIWIDILNHIKKLNPDVNFLLENVNMKKEYLRIISEYLGVFPVRLNSRLISAQNRDRWYWTNIRTKETGLFSELWTDIPEPEDKGILLKHILEPEEEVDEKYYLTDTALKRIERKNYSSPQINPDKTGTLNTKNNSGQLSVDSGTTLIKTDRYGVPKADQNKAGALTVGGHGSGNHSDMDLVLIQKPRGKNTGGVHEDKSPSMTSSSWQDNHHLVCAQMVGRRIDKNGKRKDFNKDIPAIQRLELNLEGKTFCLSTVEKDNLLTDGQVLRRLTPIECERLQTMPDNYTEGVSDTQRYKMLGNGWTMEMIKHIFSYL